MKAIKFLIPLVFLILSVVIMESGYYLKSMGSGGKIPELINSIEKDIENEKWNEATIKANELNKLFNKTEKIIQFSVEREEIFEFNIHLAQLEGYLKAKDEKNSISEIYILNKYWEELGT